MNLSSLARSVAVVIFAGALACSAQELPPVGSQDVTPKAEPLQPDPRVQELAPVGSQSGPVASAAGSRGSMELQDSTSADSLHITVGHSTVLRGVHQLRRVFVGNPTVLQSYTAGPSEIVLTAKAPGVSSLVLWDVTGQSHMYTVDADVNPADLLHALQVAYPNTKVGVEGHEGKLYLSGTVATPELADAIGRLALTHSKDVINGLRVTLHPKQVQLKLRIVEVDRSKLEQFGVNFTGPLGRTLFNATTGQFPSTITTTAPSTSATGSSTSTVSASDMLNIFLYSTKLNVGATIRALEQKQVLQVLAEPTLNAMSGQSAKFLSGGEFPFPIVQGTTAGAAPTVSIQFRPYGVRMDFTPTVNEDGSIRLKIAPEVSSLDFSQAITLSGFVVPAVATKRAETEVEIKDGQSFALSGILDRRTTESLSQIPGISRVPVLGKLFISKSYSHSIVELVVMVTATVVDPLSDTTTPAEPAMVVPNLDKQTFDRDLSREQSIKPKQK